MIRSDGCNSGILASVGRSFCEVATIRKGIEAGALNYRLALGLRDRDHVTDFHHVRAAASEAGVNVRVLLDLPASRPRIGYMEDKAFRVGDTVWIIDAEEVDPGDPGAIPLPGLRHHVDRLHPGDRVVFRDGRQIFRITTINEGRLEVECSAAVEPLSASNGCSFPDSGAVFEPLTTEDREWLARMASEGLCPDWVTVSLVAEQEQIRTVRNCLDELWPEGSIRIVPKIETAYAVDNLAAILDVADGVLLGRGDLALSVPPERLPHIQMRVAQEARRANKAYMVATQVFERFADSGAIYRAELSDVALMVRQGVDAVTLCQETSDSRYPIATIDLVRRIIEQESKILRES